MKTVSSSTIALALFGTSTFAFQSPPTPFTVSSSSSSSSTTTITTTALFEYIPSGFTKESYAKFKKDEARKKTQKKNLGRMGPKGFQSRSFQSFQEALEKGEAKHLMPVMNAKERVKKGELKSEDIPYMQRGGAWDNSDVRGAKRSKWLKSDKDYSKGGYKKEQSVSIFGKGAGLDWTGTRDKTGPYSGASASKSKKAKAAGSKKSTGDDKPKKMFFGLF